MSKLNKPSLGLNFIMNIILTMSSFIFPLITFPYISRVLLAEGNGKVQMANSLIMYFTMLAQLGIPTYGIRACAAVRDNKIELTRTVHELMIIQTVMVVISYLLFFFLLNHVPRLQEERMLYIISSISILLSSIGMEWLFKAMEQYAYITIRSLAFKVISIVAMFVLVHEQEDYILYAGISVFAAVGSNVMNLVRSHKYISLKPLWNYRIRRHIEPVFVLFMYTCATLIYTNLDSVMLGFMTTDADVGYYGVAVKIKNILVSVVTALGAVLLPRVSYYYEAGNLDAFWDMAAKAFRAVLLMAVPTTVYFMVFAKNCIFFLAGEAYSEAIMPLTVIMPALICIGLTSVTGIQILIPSKKENIILYASIVAAVADCIINALLIPTMRSTGAAIGTLSAELIVLLIHIAVLWKDIRPILRTLGIARIVGATVISALSSFWISMLNMPNFMTLATSASLFFGLYILVLYICKEPTIMQGKAWLMSQCERLKSEKYQR